MVFVSWWPVKLRIFWLRNVFSSTFIHSAFSVYLWCVRHCAGHWMTEINKPPHPSIPQWMLELVSFSFFRFCSSSKVFPDPVPVSCWLCFRVCPRLWLSFISLLLLLPGASCRHCSLDYPGSLLTGLLASTSASFSLLSTQQLEQSFKMEFRSCYSSVHTLQWLSLPSVIGPPLPIWPCLLLLSPSDSSSSTLGSCVSFNVPGKLDAVLSEGPALAAARNSLPLVSAWLTASDLRWKVTYQQVHPDHAL